MIDETAISIFINSLLSQNLGIEALSDSEQAVCVNNSPLLLLYTDHWSLRIRLSSISASHSIRLPLSKRYVPCDIVLKSHVSHSVTKHGTLS